MNRVHITNGQVFNDWLKKTVGESCVPFNEAMMSYSVVDTPFTDCFIQHRAQVHGVSVFEYIEKLKEFLDVLDHLYEIDELVLWFGKDAFCQMNLLTILCVLEEKKYHGKIKTVLFDENKDWNLTLNLPVNIRSSSGSEELYKSVLMNHELIQTEDEIMNQGIVLYLDYISDAGKLTQIVDAHPEMNEHDLIVLLLKESEDYGLSDVQAKEMIQKRRIS